MDTTTSAGADVAYDICVEGSCISPATCLTAACNPPGPQGPVTPDVPTGYVRTMPVANQPIVADPNTGLVWQGCQVGQSGPNCETGTPELHTWIPAVLYCDDLVWGGYSDWHLPDLNELFSIAGFATGWSYDTEAFPGTSWGLSFWTIESSASVSDNAYVVASMDGRVWIRPKSVWGCSVRCVRRGPVELPRFRPMRTRMSSDRT